MAKEFKEKTITINLRKVFQKPATKRAISAKNMLKAAVKKETRFNEIKISRALNEKLWERGLYTAPRKITVKIIAEKEIARVMLPAEKYEPKQEKKTDKKAKKKETINETKKEAPVEKKKESETKTTEKQKTIEAKTPIAAAIKEEDTKKA
ncbi:MAG: hypothetical protein NTY48_00205 [Candidatus Diapherotrites archaeon]|nr:hypothetical protein [Candidatus Diapherotrites archaeon]